MKQFIITQSKKEFYTSHSGLALVGLCINKLCSLPTKAMDAFPKKVGGIGLDDILRSYVGLLTMGKSDFEAITDCRDDDHFSQSLGIARIPSTETLRQRLDEVAPALRPVADSCSVGFLKKARVTITPLDTGHIPLDCDVFGMDNSKTKKEGVSRIYNGRDGYAPIAAYLGTEGWCLELELRNGSQHSQEGFIPFIERVIEKARSLSSQKASGAPGLGPRCAGYTHCPGGQKECQLYHKMESREEKTRSNGRIGFSVRARSLLPGMEKELDCLQSISDRSTRGRPTCSKG